MGDIPSTTIVPFTNTALLPSCAVGCGALYDANGGCVPPAVASTIGTTAYTSCFCANSAVAAFSTAVTGICDDACASDGLSSIANWFRDICSVDANDNAADDGGDVVSSSASTSSTSTAKAKASTGGGGTWLSNHYQWVIMLVILVVGIAGIWIGACIWRRRYLRKKDRQRSLGQKHSGSASHPSWGPGVGSGSVAAPHDPGYDSQRNSHAILTANTPVATPPLVQEKSAPKNKKRWVVNERT
ncbi:hypothetical protein B0J13DRAFT_287876 [Dactylonectria estremocensis]|uniref:Uncharacterized protein n=1 Tax=Dactylonectria estremocensis TaxID=1079267 RepID=A0A9P9F254_9HYPO|nr:hypothetical protein B0J13DRAFT_287876 [Dactylonectria estremocensis]